MLLIEPSQHPSGCFKYSLSLSLFFFWVSLPFLGPHPRHMEVPRLGSNQSCSHQPMPQPLQRQI